MSEKDHYIEKARARLDQWNAEIDRMRARLDEAGADAKIDRERQLREMRARRDEARAQLEQIGKASDAAWDDMKAGFDGAWNSISRAFESAASRFR